jgi:4-oxalmesaconate hydratase
VVPIDNVMFASEMLGAVPGIDPETGHSFDDTKRYIDQVEGLSEESRYKIFEGNARRVYPRLDALLTQRGFPAKQPGPASATQSQARAKELI